MDILLVDDNPDYLSLLKETLYANGYNVHAAEDGSQGCEMMERLHIDLFISDIKMPNLDGIKLHAYARSMDQYKETKFLFISAFRDSYSEALTLNPERDFFLDKTTPAPQIVAFVNKLMFESFAGVWV